jgi:hypothetical protein
MPKTTSTSKTTELLPAVKSPTPKAVTNAVARINDASEKFVRAGLEFYTQAGQIAFEIGYFGDEQLYRSKSPTKGVGLRAIAAHPDLKIPGEDVEARAAALSRMVATYLTFRALPPAVQPRLLDHHVRALGAVRDPGLRERLAEEAAATRPTKQAFLESVFRARQEAGESTKRAVHPGVQAGTGQKSGSTSKGNGVRVIDVTAEEVTDWTALATKMLGDPEGKMALDVVLAQRGQVIISIVARAHEPDLDRLADVLSAPSVSPEPEAEEKTKKKTPQRPAKASKAKQAPHDAEAAPNPAKATSKPSSKPSKPTKAPKAPTPETPENLIQNLFADTGNDNDGKPDEADAALGGAPGGESGGDVAGAGEAEAGAEAGE